LGWGTDVANPEKKWYFHNEIGSRLMRREQASDEKYSNVLREDE
jgi:hypothetical protein